MAAYFSREIHRAAIGASSDSREPESKRHGGQRCNRRRRQRQQQQQQIANAPFLSSSKFALSLVAMLLFSSFGVRSVPGDKDWIDSPFVGQGKPPKGNTNVYISVYLDRLINLDEQRYTFAISLYIFLSWQDARAPAAMKAATAAAEAPGGECKRPCSGQLTPDGNPCCDEIWLPDIVIRNVEEYPQGRQQPYHIDVSEEGVVTWRVAVRANMLTTLFVASFPFDQEVRPEKKTRKMAFLAREEEEKVAAVLPRATATAAATTTAAAKESHLLSPCSSSSPSPSSSSSPSPLSPPHPRPSPPRKTLDMHLSSFVPNPSVSDVTFVPSARGLKLFTLGSGDDLSGFDAEDIHIFTSSEPFPRQFDDDVNIKRQVVARSARGDPAPLVPAFVDGSGSKKNKTSALVAKPYGADSVSKSITIAIVVRRIALYYVLGMIVPILLLAGLAILTLFIDPRLIETRLTSILSLYLANVALLFVFESDLPRSSYVLPLRQLALMSHLLLFCIAIETIVVYNIESLSDVRTHFLRMRGARSARARITRMKKEDAAAAAAASSASESATPRASVTGRRNALARRISSALEIQVPGIRRPWAARGISGNARGAPIPPHSSSSSPTPDSTLSASLATVEEGRAGATTARLRGGTANGGAAAAASTAAAATAAAGNNNKNAVVSPFSSSEGRGPAAATASDRGSRPGDGGADEADGRSYDGGSTAGEAISSSTAARAAAAVEREEERQRRENIKIAELDENIARGYHSYLAWLIDLTAAASFFFIYCLTAILIFVVSSARAPDVCRLSGVNTKDCEATLRREREHRGL